MSLPLAPVETTCASSPAEDLQPLDHDETACVLSPVVVFIPPDPGEPACTTNPDATLLHINTRTDVALGQQRWLALDHLNS